MLLALEGLQDGLVGGEVGELVVGGDAVQVGECQELFLRCGLLHQHVVEGGLAREEPGRQAVREVRHHALHRVAGEGHGLVEVGEVVEGGVEVGVVDGGGGAEEEVDEREAVHVAVFFYDHSFATSHHVVVVVVLVVVLS